MHGHAQSWGQPRGPGACAVASWSTCPAVAAIAAARRSPGTLLWLVYDFLLFLFRLSIPLWGVIRTGLGRGGVYSSGRSTS